MSKDLLDQVFGEDSTGQTPTERAKTSTRTWIRSQNELMIDSPEAKGLQMSAEQTLAIFGLPVLEEVQGKGWADIRIDHSEPAASLRRRRQKFGWTQERLAKVCCLSLTDVQDAEDPTTSTSMFVLDRICFRLELDLKRLSVKRY
ncbi:helix-turn-helix domain-containing protein [Patescibacteria group bacterium]